MRTAVTTFLAGLLAITMAVPAGADDLAAIDAAETTSDWIVTLVDGTRSRQVAPGLARLAGGEVGFVFDKVLGGFSFTGSPRAAAALRQNPMVASVVAGGTFELQEVQTGVSRISGDDLHSFGGGAYRGSGVRVAVIDSGIDLDHPDLVANIDGSAGINCVTPGASPDDDNSHGTHVAGIIGASLNGTGVVGVAPEATLVPVKAFDAGGNATTAQVLCGINYVAGLAEDGVPTVANMSFGEAGSDSTCDDGDTSDAIHEAVCDLVDKGVIAVAAAGNNSGSAEEFIPAVFDEVISVSALTDLDGAPGGLGGCLLIFIFCDDEFAYFSNFGPSVDVIAPGDPILSTVPGGGYGEKSGTSMAAPHVSGVVAAMLSADPALTRSAAQALLQTSGECPSGATNSGGPTCGTEIWPGDPDGVGEPLVNALRAVELTVATAGGSGNIPPIVSFDRSCTELTCDFVDTSWEPDGTIVSWAWDFGDGGTSDLPNPTHTFGAEGTYSVVLTVTDNDGATGTGTRDVTVPSLFGPGVQGDWVGVYGADGYGLAAWNSGSDLVVSDRMTVSLEQGSRHSWASPTTDGRALESPDQAERRAAAWYSSSEVRLSLGFADAFAGDLHLYSVDWDSDARRQTLIVDDGNGPQTVAFDAAFSDGAWVHFPISVAAGGSVTVRAVNDGPTNAVLSGVMLGDDVVSPPPPPPPPPPPGLGDWVGVYGADGYGLAAWNRRSDLVSPDFPSIALLKGRRTRWASPTTETRALESPDQSERRAATYYHKSQLKVQLSFTAAYSGNLHLYALDWDSTTRRQTVTVDDGNGSQTIDLTTSFNEGFWMHFPIDVGAGETVLITATKTAGSNAVIAGMFLGE